MVEGMEDMIDASGLLVLCVRGLIQGLACLLRFESLGETGLVSIPWLSKLAEADFIYRDIYTVIMYSRGSRVESRSVGISGMGIEVRTLARDYDVSSTVFQEKGISRK